MTYTDKDLKAIIDAITKLQNGERIASVAYDTYTVHYAPVQLKELMSLRDKIVAELKAARGLKVRQILINTTKGTE